MRTKLNISEIPVAYTMIATAQRVKPRRDGQHPYQVYFYLWTAFDNICTFLAGREGLRPRLSYNADGSVARYVNGGVNIPIVEEISEKDQMQVAIEALDGDLQHHLIEHDSTRYFAHRAPYWQGKKIEYDAAGQKVNGVINVKSTLDVAYPVWSPIDIKLFSEYFGKPTGEATRKFLVQQIVELLHTVRDNLMLGGKQFDDATDHSVIKHALPLLEIIVKYFIQSK